MKIKKAFFLKSCSSVKDFPEYPFPEFAFMGRSNVGKSSLINMITGRKDLVKIGSRPGVTKSINFFLLNDNTSLADLPGFGYSKLPKELKKTFLPLIRSYINSRKNLRLAFLLIDIRRVPDEFEREIITLLSSRDIPVAIIATKCDKLSKSQRKINGEKIAAALFIKTDSIFFSSAKTREGRKEILDLIGDPRRRSDKE
jgi:GTP-binding protein